MRVSRPSLLRFFQQQSLYLSLAAVVAAIFWAVGQDVNPLTILVYSLCLGNLTKTGMEKATPLYGNRRFPHNWLMFLLVLAVLMPPIYLISSTLVWWIAPPSPQTLEHYLRTGWKFPILITVVFSVGMFLYETTRERLERRNRELQRNLAQGAAQLEVQNEELKRAREIQESLLPKSIPQLPGFEVAGAWLPARMVSGDYYDVFPLGDHKLCICIADVVGKGVSAALLTAHAQAAVRALSSQSESPATLCGRVNRLLCENIATGKFVTFFYAILDSETRTLSYCNAGILIRFSSLMGTRTFSTTAAPCWAYFPSGPMRMLRFRSNPRTVFSYSPMGSQKRRRPMPRSSVKKASPHSRGRTVAKRHGS